MEQQKTSSEVENPVDELKNLLYVSIISADNDEFTEEQKQDVIRRYNVLGDEKDWDFIFEPLGEIGQDMAKLFKD